VTPVAGDGGAAVDRPADPAWYRIGLVAAALVATAIRVVNILVVRPTCLEDMVARVETGGPMWNPAECPSGEFAIWGDSAYGYLQARLLARGHGFVDGATWFLSGGTTVRDSAGDPPLYAMFLGVLARLGFTGGTAMRLGSAAAGVVGVVLLGILARRVRGPRAGVLAAGFAAVYPMLWINDGMLLSESLFVPMVGAALLAAYRLWDRPEARSAAVLGLAIGLAALTRAEAALLVVVPVVPLLWGARQLSVGRRVALGAVCSTVAAMTLAPWFAYNLTRFEEPVLMTSQTGAVLSAASCDSTFYGERLGYWDDCMSWYVATGRVVGWPDPSLDESERDAVPRAAAVRYTKEHVGRLPVVAAARIGRLWDVYEPLESVRFNAVIEGRGLWASRLGIAAYAALAPLGVLGAIVLRRARTPLSPLVAMPLIVTVTAAATFGITRYRTPGDAALVVLAAVGADWLAQRRWPHDAVPSVRPVAPDQLPPVAARVTGSPSTAEELDD
jgi:hypothetical protein